MLEGISEDGANEAVCAGSELNNHSRQESDMQLLEKLFKKVQNGYGIDKKQLLKKLLEPSSSALGPKSAHSKKQNRNILAGLNGKSGIEGSSRQEDMSID